MIYTRHSNGLVYVSNNTTVVDILSKEEMKLKVKSQTFLQKMFNPIKIA